MFQYPEEVVCLMIPYIIIVLAPLVAGTLTMFRLAKTLRVGNARAEVQNNARLRAWTYATLVGLALIMPMFFGERSGIVVARAGLAILFAGLLAILVLSLCSDSLSPMLRRLTKVKILNYTFIVLHGALALDGLMFGWVVQPG